MPDAVEISLFDNQFEALARALPKSAERIARRNARRVRDAYRQEAPKDSEALSVSAYEVLSDGSSTYTAAVAAARGKNRAVEVLPQDEAPPEGQAIVAIAVVYGATVEEGGAHTTANPALQRAVDAVKPQYDADLAALEDEWRRG